MIARTDSSGNIEVTLNYLRTSKSALNTFLKQYNNNSKRLKSWAHHTVRSTPQKNGYSSIKRRDVRMCTTATETFLLQFHNIYT